MKNTISQFVEAFMPTFAAKLSATASIALVCAVFPFMDFLQSRFAVSVNSYLGAALVAFILLVGAFLCIAFIGASNISLIKRNAVLEPENQQQKTTIEQLQQQGCALEGKYNDAQAKNSDLQKENAALNTQISALQKELSEVKNALETLEQNHEAMCLQIHELVASNQRLEDHLEQVKSDNSTLQSKNKSLQKKMDVLAKENNELKNKPQTKDTAMLAAVPSRFQGDW